MRKEAVNLRVTRKSAELTILPNYQKGSFSMVLGHTRPGTYQVQRMTMVRKVEPTRRAERKVLQNGVKQRSTEDGTVVDTALLLGDQS
jgi:hypothetical protein